MNEDERILRRRLLWRMGIVSLLPIIVMVIASIWMGTRLPAGTLVPTHWNILGQPDAYASATKGLYLMPFVMLLLLLVVLLLFAVLPLKWLPVRSLKAFTVAMVSFMGIMLTVHLVTLWATLRHGVDINFVLMVVSSLAFIVVGNCMGKIRPNRIMGVRTLWTYASDLSWDKTHRLAGRLLVAFGLFSLLLTLTRLVPSIYLILMLLGGLILVAVIAVVYSYLIWRVDPNRRPIGIGL